MPRVVRCGLIQASCEWSPEKYSLADIKEKMIAKHEKMIAPRRRRTCKFWACRSFSTGHISARSNRPDWYELTESVPDGPTLARMQKLAKKYQMVLVVPDLRSGNDGRLSTTRRR